MRIKNHFFVAYLSLSVAWSGNTFNRRLFLFIGMHVTECRQIVEEPTGEEVKAIL